MKKTDFPSRRRFLQTGAAASMALATGCHKRVIAGTTPQALAPAAHSASRPQGASAAADALMKQLAAEQDLLFGFAVTGRLLRQDAAYRDTVLQQASIIVAENAMKWGPLRPTPEQYFFEEADYLVDFAEKNALKIRGHNLCWHNQLPHWFSSVFTPANARQLLTDHIRTVAGRYAGRMQSWDVVNEAVQPSDGRPDMLRNSPWMQLVGSDYIELAFRTAREADPQALLTYNEYGIESESADDARKRAATLMLLRRLRQRNVPLDAVGIQSHIRAGGTYGAGLQQFLRECREMQLQVFLTEMDVNDRSLPADVAVRDAGVAETYSEYLACVLPEPNVRAVLTWGVNDGQSWLSGLEGTKRADGLPQRSLLYDNSFHKKPDFFAAAQVISARHAARSSAR